MSIAPPVAFHHPKTTRARVPYFDRTLGVTVLRGIGFRAVCDCGWQGPLRDVRPVAGLDLCEHLEDARGR